MKHAEMLTVEEARAVLRVGRRRFRQLLATGAIPSVRFGPRLRRVPRAALSAWIERATK